MSKVLRFGGEIFWLGASVVFGLAVVLFVLHMVESHVGGIPGTVAGDIESAITPRG